MVPSLKEGDRRAQRRVFDALAPKMMAVCLRYMGNKDDAEDVLQEGFVTLFTKIDSYSGAGSFEGWARKIFVNTALMHLRRTDALGLSDDIEEARTLFTEEATPIERIGYKELLRMIAALPPEYRTVFNLYVLEGYSHKDIAEELGCTEATSRSRLQRARLKLQEMIRAQK
jgi:RNA polymerase sigma-70 factor (ECF subfamily)